MEQPRAEFCPAIIAAIEALLEDAREKLRGRVDWSEEYGPRDAFGHKGPQVEVVVVVVQLVAFLLGALFRCEVAGRIDH